MIKAIFLDIDNTLLDFDAYVRDVMKKGFSEFELAEYDDAMYETFTRINNRLWRQIEEGSITYQELYDTRWDLIFAELGIVFDGKRFERYFRENLFDYATPVEGATEALAYLSGRYILCAASNGPYEQQLNRLKVGGMYDFFSYFFISEKVGFSKPSEQFFLHGLSELNKDRQALGEPPILPEEVLMLGDSLTSDIAGALGVGFQTCFFDKHQKGIKTTLPIGYGISRLEEIRSFL